MRFFSNGNLRMLALCASAAALAACGGGGSSSISTPQGTLRVSLTDAPACGFDQVNVTVDRVRVHASSNANENDSGWTDLLLTAPRTINLLDLANGVLEELGSTPLAAGDYTQLRLVLTANSNATPMANSVRLIGGAENTALITPSAVQSGIKLVHQFSVAAGSTADVVLDFDACHSIVARGNGSYSLKPVVQVVPRTVAGIAGNVTGTSTVVSAQKNGVVIRSTVPSSTGEFTIPFLDPAGGPYDVVFTAPAKATAVVSSVPVSASGTTLLSTISAPITLADAPSSYSVSGAVGPTAARDSAVVRALQAVGSVPAVEVARVTVNPITGGYSVTLPTTAPRLAAYATTLPLSFAPQNASAAVYTIEASATGYAKATVTPPSLTGNITRDFTLVPTP
jgi:hypothetical protein